MTPRKSPLCVSALTNNASFRAEKYKIVTFIHSSPHAKKAVPSTKKKKKKDSRKVQLSSSTCFD